MDKSEKILNQNQKINMPFKVPEGYFEKFPEKLDEKILNSGQVKIKTSVLQIKRYLAAAAIIIAVLTAATLILRTERPGESLNEQISQAIEMELHNIPESVILEMVAGSSSGITEVRSQEEIIDYLLNESLQYEDLLNGM